MSLLIKDATSRAIRAHVVVLTPDVPRCTRQHDSYISNHDFCDIFKTLSSKISQLRGKTSKHQTLLAIPRRVSANLTGSLKRL